MKNIKFIFFTLCFFTTITSNAWHLTGGEMFYECLGNNQYQITIQVYRDFNTQQGSAFDNPLLLSVFDGNGQTPNGFSNPLSIPYNNVSMLSNQNFCAINTLDFEMATYTTYLTLPLNASGYHISYQRCCLNANISNVFNPNNYGMTLTTFISTYALSVCNSSPQFNHNVTPTFCIGSPILMDYSGSDINGDSLVYSFSEPYHGLSTANPSGISSPPPYSYVPFIPPYTVNQPLGTNITIDSSTGIISGVLNNAGNYYFGIKIADYQNGILISETRRIFLIHMVACNFITLNMDVDICGGESFSIREKTYNSSGNYQISTQSPEGCDTTINLNLTVAPEITLFDSTIIHDDGNSSGAINFQLTDSMANYTYLWNNGHTTSSLNNVVSGIYNVTVTNDSGCSEFFEFEILLDTKTRFIKNEQFEINISPNPVLTTDIININIEAKESNDLEIGIYNVNGQRLKTINQTIQKGENQIEVKLNVAKGIYFILIKDNRNQLIERLPIIIQ
jgi:hypothetical protein